MKKVALITLALATSFCFGFAFKSVTTDHSNANTKTKRVTGIGLNTNQYGTVFEWFQGADSTKKGFSQWSPFKETTEYFEPSTKEFMINYRVENLELLVEELKKEGVAITDTLQTFDYGKFIHIMDVEGNKIELWESNDIVYEKLGIQMGSKTTK